MSRRSRRSVGMSAAFGASSFDESGDVNPNEYLTNLSDCMLVLAVGFIVALIVAWNVKLPDYTVLDERNLTEVEDVERIEQQINGQGNAYNKIGEVYQDPVTGKTYVLEDIDGGATEGGDGEGASTSAGGASDSDTSGGSTGSDANVGSANNRSSMQRSDNG